MKFSFGIEHEVAFIRSDGQFADFSNTTFEELDALIAQLPHYEADYPQLRVGDAGIKVKRWYIEGFERFSEMGQLTGCAPKGIELRTTIHSSIDETVNQLTQLHDQLYGVAQPVGFTPALTSYNPYQPSFEPVPPLNGYEQHRRASSAEKRTATIPMMTFGPDLNLSVEGLSTAQIIDYGQKLTYYSPFILPFSYSSPFYQGQLWDGLSIRTYERTGKRPAAMVFLEHADDLIVSQPSLTKIARVPAEVGRIEFKAFDSCGDFQLYSSLLALLKGVIMDTTLSGRGIIPSASLHQRSARLGFRDEAINVNASMILMAADRALKDDSDREKLKPLHRMLEKRWSPADGMVAQFKTGRSLNDILLTSYPRQLALASA